MKKILTVVDIVYRSLLISYHKNKEHQKNEDKEINGSKKLMCSPHCRKIKVTQYHTKLCVNTGRESTILLHVSTENKVRKLSKGEKLDKEHNCKRSKIRQALKRMITGYLYAICRQMFKMALLVDYEFSMLLSLTSVRVPERMAIVLLKEMYLNILIKPRKIETPAQF